MKFGEFPLDKAAGGILAHSIAVKGGKRLRKGLKISADDIDLMKASGISSVVIAVPEDADLLEDDAAAQIAACFKGGGIRVDDARTGRVNFFASENGIFRVDSGAVDALNRIDPGIGFSTLPNYAEVNEGRMIATVKVIPYAVSTESVDAVKRLDLEKVISVTSYREKTVGLIFTKTGATKESVLDKTRNVLQRRLQLSGSRIVSEKRVDHDSDAVASAIAEISPQCDILILFGASAISDQRDVIPSAIEEAGGKIVRFGMPVDPGNLLLLASLDGKAVVGAPGCARSPAENGFDWVLQRLLADIEVTSDSISGMGVGGLLMETGARPHPRELPASNVSKKLALVLAAGQSRRMGAQNKMTVEISGKAMVRHVVEAALASSFDKILVVTGHEAEKVRAALENCPVEFVNNDQFAEGLSASLRCGIEVADREGFSHALVMLGDMPFVSAEKVDQMIKTAEANPDNILLATSQGKRGNPVMWPSRYYEELKHISGDVGARHIIGKYEDDVIEVELGTAAAIDLDTPEAVRIHAGDSSSEPGQ